MSPENISSSEGRSWREQFEHHAWITIWSSCKCFIAYCRRNINFHQTFYLKLFLFLSNARGKKQKNSFLISMHSFNSSGPHYICCPDSRLRLLLRHFMVYKHKQLHDFIQSEIASLLHSFLLHQRHKKEILNCFFTYDFQSFNF